MLRVTYRILKIIKVIVTVFAVLSLTYYLVQFIRNRCNFALPASFLYSPPKNSEYKFERRNLKFEVAPRAKELFKVELEFFEYNVFSRVEGRNNAIVNDRNCIHLKNDTHRRRIVVISNFIFYREPKLKSTMYTNYKERSTDEEIEARINEILETLRGNLKHPEIHSAHIFVENRDAIPYLLSLPFENSDKLVVKLAKKVTLTAMLKYASDCLQGLTVAITNQDNRFGEGWDKLDHDILKKHKLMYALTRHPSRHLCLSTLSQAYCGRLTRNAACHDTFVLHMNRKFTDQMLSPLQNLTQTAPGMEHMLIWTFRNLLFYKVTNPCLVLYVHHEHCVPIRETGRRRMKNAKADSAAFTDSLKP